MAESPIHVQAHPAERGRRRGVVLNAGCCCCCCLHTAGSLLGALGGSIPKLNARPASWVPPTPREDVLSGFHPGERPAPRSDIDEQFIEHLGPPGSLERSQHIAEALTRPGEPPADDGPAVLPRDFPDAGEGRSLRGLSGTVLYWLVLLALTPLLCVGLAYYNRRLGGEPDYTAGFLIGIFGFLPGVQLGASLVAAILVLFWPPRERDHRYTQILRITGWSLVGTLGGVFVMGLCCGLMSLGR